MDLETILEMQIKWSRKTFGAGYNPKRLIAHIQKELAEIEEKPLDVYEWIDVAILALDGAWRCLARQWSLNEHVGLAPSVCKVLRSKLLTNVVDRKWSIPQDPDAPVEHLREG